MSYKNRCSQKDLEAGRFHQSMKNSIPKSTSDGSGVDVEAIKGFAHLYGPEVHTITDRMRDWKTYKTYFIDVDLDGVPCPRTSLRYTTHIEISKLNGHRLRQS